MTAGVNGGDCSTAVGLVAGGVWWWNQSRESDALVSYEELQGRWPRGARRARRRRRGSPTLTASMRADARRPEALG